MVDQSSCAAKWGYSGSMSYLPAFNINNGADNIFFYTSVDGTNGGASRDLITFSVPDLGIQTWYHITWTYDNPTKKYRLYINGSQVDTRTGTIASIYNGGQAFIVGFDGQGGYMDGLIANVHIYDSAIGTTTIQDIYNCASDYTDAVSQWNFNNDGLDENTTNSNDLTNNNSATFQSANLPTYDCAVPSSDAGQEYLYSDDITIITGYGTTTDGYYRRTYIHAPAIAVIFLVTISIFPLLMILNKTKR